VYEGWEMLPADEMCYDVLGFHRSLTLIDAANPHAFMNLLVFQAVQSL